MKTNDEEIDKLIAGSIRSIGLDEPSADFTLNVMQAITVEKPVIANQSRYWWWLSLIPLLMGLIWGSIYFFKLSGPISHFFSKVISSAQPLFGSITTIPEQLKAVKIPPILILGFVAIMMLLAIEELISRTKHAS